jgi:hypothetical protein
MNLRLQTVMENRILSIKRPILICIFLFLITFIISIVTFQYKTKFIRMDQNESDFYIHLKSDVRLTSPLMVGNTIGNFITRLNRRYNLTDEYKVALSRLHYTKSWYNIEGNHFLWLANSERKAYVLPDEFPQGNYITVEEIIDLLNQMYDTFCKMMSDEIESPPVFQYNRYSNTIRVKLGIKKNETGQARFLYPTTTEYLARFLGLADLNDRQYPFSDPSSIIIKKVKKTDSPVPVSIAQQYHQQVNKLSVEMKDFKETVTRLLNERTEQPNANNAQQTADASFENQQKLNKSNRSEKTSSERQIKPREDDIDFAQSDAPYDEQSNQSQIEPEKVKKPLVSREVEMSNDEPAEDDTEEIAYIYAFRQVNLHGYINNLNIYCNLLKPVSVGDVDVPLLRSVAVNPEDAFGKYIEYEPHIREYVPLLYHEFENIEIDIKSDEDKTIDFKFGQVYLSLHFRKSHINS